MLNSVALVGRLVRDPDTINDTGVRFTLAVTRSYTPKGKDKMTDFFPVTVWGKAAETVRKYCHKGMQVGVEGSLQNNSWEDKETGRRMTTTEINASRVHFLEPKDRPSRPEDYNEIAVDDEDDLPF